MPPVLPKEEAPPAPPAAVVQQSVHIESVPTGATVVVKGKMIGRAPLKLALQRGSYEFQLRRKGFHTVAKTIHIDTISDEEHQYVWNLRKRVRRPRMTTQRKAAPKIRKRVPEKTVPEAKEKDSPVVERPPKPLRIHILGSDDLSEDSGSSSDSDRKRPRVRILE